MFTEPFPFLRFIETVEDGTPGVAVEEATPGDDNAQDVDQSQDSEQAQQNEDDADPDGADALGDPGKRALNSMKERWRKERAARIEAERKLAESNGDSEDTVRDEIRREVLSEANQRILKAEIRGRATALLQDPADALRYLDLDEFDVGDNGEVDDDELTAALQELIESRPYLAKKDVTPQGGNKKRVPAVPAAPAHTPSAPATLDDQIKAAQASGDWKAVLALQNQKLAQSK